MAKGKRKRCNKQLRLNKEKIKNENIEKNKMKIVWFEDDNTSISVSCGYKS